MDGVQLIVELNEQAGATSIAPPVVMLTTIDDNGLVRGALDAGAAGFLLKDASVDELVGAIRAVVDGGLVIDPRVARLALRRSQGSGTDPDADQDDVTVERSSALDILTRAELAVAALVATGATNSEIAARLTLAEGTIKNHVTSLLRKLDQRDRTALALMLSRHLRGDTPGAQTPIVGP